MVYAVENKCRLPIFARRRLTIPESLSGSLATSGSASGLIIVIDARIVDKLGIGCPTGRPALLSEVDGSRQNLKAPQRI
jgi:hypothetical protein